MSLQQWLAIYENWAPAHLVRMYGRGVPLQVARDAIEFARQQMLDQRPSDITTAGPARAWLTKVANRHAAEILRTERRHAEILEDGRDRGELGNEVSREEDSPEVRAILAEFLALMGESLRRLPLAEHYLIHARYIDERTLREIAEPLGRSIAAVHKAIAQILAELQERLRQRGIDGTQI